jgi:hypothetical protein
MIAFITSFRARALARDWDHNVMMLERAVQSILAQVHGKSCVVVACHEIPETPLARESRVHFLPVNFSPPARTNNDMCVDKVLKLSVGAHWARAQGYQYVVFTDADDLVSNRIVKFIADHSDENGWYCPAVMFYTYGGRFMRFVAFRGAFAGPCLIVRTNLLQFEAPPFLGSWTKLVIADGESNYLELLGRHGQMVNTLAAVGLGRYREYMTNEGYPLGPLPFPPIVMINHADSTSLVGGGQGSYQPVGLHTVLRRSLKWLPSVRFLTRSVRNEFLIPPNNEIPNRYRRQGSIFWR